jgi:hypothetical protein
VTESVFRSEEVAPLSVDADLTVTVAGTTAEVRSTGDRVFVAFASLPGAVRALRSVPDGGETALHEFLATADLTVEIRVHDRTVAVAGADARPGFVSAQLGVAPVEFRLGGALGAVGESLRGLGRWL